MSPTLNSRDSQEDEQVLLVDGNRTSSRSSTYDSSFNVETYEEIDERIEFYMWVADSGSSAHIANNKELFKNLTSVQKEI